MTNNFGDVIAMERKRRFTLNQDKYKQWEEFVANNYEEIYQLLWRHIPGHR